jgi:glycosyltransferase involved in cell wall biosynthesis
MASSCLVEFPLLEDTACPAVAARGEPVRVLHVINGEHYAGAERVQDLLAAGLGPLGFDVAQVCVKPGSFAAMRQAQSVPLHLAPMRNRFDLRPAWKLARLVRQGGFRLIHSHSVRTALVGSLAAAMTGVPLVHHLHSPTDCDSTRGWQDRMNAWAERLGVRRAAAVLAVSASLGEYAERQGYAAEKVTVVPNGVPRRRPVPMREPAKQTWTLGMVALFRPRKGIEVLLRAMARLRSDGLAVRLRAVGDFESAEYGRQVKCLSEQLGLTGAIDWLGFQRDVDAQLAEMDLFVLPSLFGEGLPMVLLEAMSAGLPIVSTRVEGIPEAVRHGREGLLATPGDPLDLAGAIALVVRGQVDWRVLRAACLARHAERYSETRMTADVAAVYRRVLSGKI